jgi:hypothetical protein
VTESTAKRKSAYGGTQFRSMPTSYGAPRGKRTSYHYKVKERDQIKTVFALSVDSAMSCMTKLQFIFRNRKFLTRKNLFVAMLMLQLSDKFIHDSYSCILSRVCVNHLACYPVHFSLNHHPFPQLKVQPPTQHTLQCIHQSIC